eukprot:1332879-Alexandrium_andersonii.AAC.1
MESTVKTRARCGGLESMASATLRGGELLEAESPGAWQAQMLGVAGGRAFACRRRSRPGPPQ